MNDNKFTFNYSAPTREERREIEDIKKQYSGEAEVKTKIAQLRELDARVKTPPLILAICLGVAGVLIFGTGLTLALEWNKIVWGAVVMAVGCVPVACAHPLRLLLLKRNKKKYGGQIVKLSEELLNETDAKN